MHPEDLEALHQCLQKLTRALGEDKKQKQRWSGWWRISTRSTTISRVVRFLGQTELLGQTKSPSGTKWALTSGGL